MQTQEKWLLKSRCRKVASSWDELVNKLLNSSVCPECPSERETLRTLGALLSKRDLSLPVGQCLISQGGLEPLGALLLPWPLLSSPHRGGMLAWAPRLGVAAGLCHSEGSCLTETFQDRQGIKQSRAPVMWAGAGQKGKKKRVCSHEVDLLRHGTSLFRGERGLWHQSLWHEEYYFITTLQRRGTVIHAGQIPHIRPFLWFQSGNLSPNPTQPGPLPLLPVPSTSSARVVFAGGMQDVQICSCLI